MEGSTVQYYERVACWASRAKYRYEVETLLRRLDFSPCATILDVGCGSGRATAILQRRGHHGIGVDRARTWAAVCRTRPVVRADAGELPFSCDSFDGAILMHSLAHFVRPRTVVGEIRRILRPGGRLGIVTPNAHFLATCRAGTHRSRPGYQPDPTVEQHFDVFSLRSLLEDHKFSVLTCAPFGRRPRNGRGPTARERLVAVAQKADGQARTS